MIVFHVGNVYVVYIYIYIESVESNITIYYNNSYIRKYLMKEFVNYFKNKNIGIILITVILVFWMQKWNNFL